MVDCIKRKCFYCKKDIVATPDTFSEVIKYKNNYYHINCFTIIAEKRATANRSTAINWEIALDNIERLKKETTTLLEQSWTQDNLNYWLLQHYNIVSVPHSFWTMIAELAQGKYRSKKCKPIDMKTLLGAWQWGQKKLDEIAARNKTSNKGPKNGEERLNYDLAILIQHLPDYFKYISTTKETEKEIRTVVQNVNKFDYEKIYKETNKKEETNNILDLMNDIF